MQKDERFILSCIDDSTVSDAVCDYASWLSGKMHHGLKILHAIEHSKQGSVSDLSGSLGLGTSKELLNDLVVADQKRGKIMIEDGQRLLKNAKKRLSSSSAEIAVELIQRHGAILESILDIQKQVSVFIIGIRGTSQERRQGDRRTDSMSDKPATESRKSAEDRRIHTVGNNLESIIRSTNRPILVVNKDFSEPKKTMLAYDGSESCKKALNLLSTNEAFKEMPCHIVHVGSNGKEILQEAEKILKNANVSVTTAELSGNVEDALIAYQESNDIDVTLMGAFSHGKIHGFFRGSFTAKMLAKTDRPLFLLR